MKLHEGMGLPINSLSSQHGAACARRTQLLRNPVKKFAYARVLLGREPRPLNFAKPFL